MCSHGDNRVNIYLECLTRPFRSNFISEIRFVLSLMTTSCERMMWTEIIPQNVSSTFFFAWATTQTSNSTDANATALIIFSLYILSIIQPTYLISINKGKNSRLRSLFQRQIYIYKKNDTKNNKNKQKNQNEKQHLSCLLNKNWIEQRKKNK